MSKFEVVLSAAAPRGWRDVGGGVVAVVVVQSSVWGPFYVPQVEQMKGIKKNVTFCNARKIEEHK